jgi:hypothetical protein
VRALLAGIAVRPLIQRFATIGVVSGAVIGGIGGLIRGLEVHPATAWFAVVELGVPVAIAGWVLGLSCGLLVAATRRIKHHRPAPRG